VAQFCSSNSSQHQGYLIPFALGDSGIHLAFIVELKVAHKLAPGSNIDPMLQPRLYVFLSRVTRSTFRGQLVQTVLDDETVRTNIGSIRQKKEIIKKVTRYLHAPLRYPPLTRSVANPVLTIARKCILIPISATCSQDTVQYMRRWLVPNILG